VILPAENRKRQENKNVKRVFFIILIKTLVNFYYMHAIHHCLTKSAVVLAEYDHAMNRETDKKPMTAVLHNCTTMTRGVNIAVAGSARRP